MNENKPPIGMQCEYGNCKRKGADYIKPKHLKEKGWEDEPIYLCEYHANELKCTELVK